jgi:hypothetical protein
VGKDESMSDRAEIEADLKALYPNWHRMTKAQRKAAFVARVREICEELAAEGTLRVVGTDSQGRKIYAHVSPRSKPKH